MKKYELYKEEITDVQALQLKQNICPFCSVTMLLFSSLHIKHCDECKRSYPWTLKESELPLVKHQR